MRKIILIVIVLIVMLVIGGVLLFSRSRIVPPASSLPIASTTGSQDGVPWGPIYSVPTSTGITLGSPHGSVTMKNFYATSLGAEDQFIVLASTSDYQITYDTDANAFYLYVAASPFAANRAAAEAAFLSQLGVSDADACKLSVQEGYIPNAPADTGASSLSFCASGAFGASE